MIVSPRPVSPSPLLSVTEAVLVTSMEGSAVMAKSTEFEVALTVVLDPDPVVEIALTLAVFRTPFSSTAAWFTK